MNLYAQPMNYLWGSGFPKTTKIASYSDAPIKNQEFPIGYSWKAILDDPSSLNYYMKDSLTQKVGCILCAKYPLDSFGLFVL
jgi:hypothetical protein